MKIIILHGLYMHGLVMQPLSQKLRKLGYETQVISYNTVAIDESSLFDSIDHSLNPLTANVLVGHSLGGLMVKRYLANRKPTTSLISHVVAIGSPLKGASIVGRIQDLGLGAILGNSPHHGLNKHDDAWAFPQKLGSIAGTVPIGARSLLIRNDNTMSDGTVTVEETRLDGMQDHIEVKQTHTSLIYNTFVPQQIDHFIRTDYFRR
ncbi:cobinamide adenolsyltransferase [Vibrio parahaemolyticus]|uniref:cob(I)alamin adenolsyltransferase/cobinamide ATP-dependent adenolsyltransferase n=1 Tax=Vibrio parahaemolyticus TaxID=670 RepID=UPI0005433CD2|nr:cob(I)alamin adenolsyltransferase/cobinamide ATP-dependent adenolsyltransferase [Vibrio parahaemolyticus]KHF14244.1 cobinamide adenolsyltransferase [Vibrio parahaemolyticus]MBE3887960.1 triacylglycerol lipase [Vibrio parahaemolyticus]OTW00817.1 cobinamide adenolsyltransferase [Vibrio parahaemolyticus]OTW06434.1 cobinamide adenolsyltransferase [Vibrio parahaemolyticus]TNY56880.1 cobinamide adenolsyltransferase [Vibrio parahaemolyticus]